MKYSNLISGIFWLTFGFLLSFWSTRYQIWSLTEPGSGFFPLALGLLLILFSTILLLQAKKSSLAPQKILPSYTRGGSKRVGYTFLILFLGNFLFEKIGCLFTIFLMIIFLMYGAGSRSWKTILLVAFFSVVGVYLVFVLLLKQLYPRGPLGI